jgi:hypothetical protein
MNCDSIPPDMEILARIPDHELANMCQANSYLAELCQDQHLWKMRLEYYYGERVLQDKPKEMNYQEWYQQIDKKIRDPYEFTNWVIANDYLGLFTLFYHDLSISNDSLAEYAADQGSYQIAQWLAQQNILPQQGKINVAAIHGNVQLLDMYHQHGYIPMINGLTWAASSGNLETVKWFLQHGIEPTSKTAEYAAENGHIDLLYWLEREYGVVPEEYEFAVLIEDGSIEVLNFAEAHGLRPTQEDVDYVHPADLSSEMRQWLVERGYAIN